MAMLDLQTIGLEVARMRKAMRLPQRELASKARVSRATLEALENGRIRELGFARLSRILLAAGLELRLGEVRSSRPTLDDLMQDDGDDQSLGRRR